MHRKAIIWNIIFTGCIQLPSTRSDDNSCNPDDPSCILYQIKVDKENCSKQLGAQWNQATFECHRPSNLKECNQADSKLIWDGTKCIYISQDKNLSFYLACINPEKPKAQAQTIDAILHSFDNQNCQQVHQKLLQKKSLTLRNLQIKSLEPIKSLTHLERLDLWANDIEDITPLAQMKNLIYLNLGQNHIQDISTLSNLTTLTELLIFENQISNLEPISHIKQLKKLDISHNPITSLQPIEGMKFENGLFKDKIKTE